MAERNSESAGNVNRTINSFPYFHCHERILIYLETGKCLELWFYCLKLVFPSCKISLTLEIISAHCERQRNVRLVVWGSGCWWGMNHYELLFSGDQKKGENKTGRADLSVDASQTSLAWLFSSDEFCFWIFKHNTLESSKYLHCNPVSEL